jgi:hypothetical protein
LVQNGYDYDYVINHLSFVHLPSKIKSITKLNNIKSRRLLNIMTVGSRGTMDGYQELIECFKYQEDKEINNLNGLKKDYNK